MFENVVGGEFAGIRVGEVDQHALRRRAFRSWTAGSVTTSPSVGASGQGLLVSDQCAGDGVDLVAEQVARTDRGS